MRSSRLSRYFGSRPYPPGRSRSVQVVMGVNPRAAHSGKLRASTPAENEIGTSGRARLYLSTRFSVITWRGAPDRYITASEEGKKDRWFRTTSVFENLTWKRRPREP